MAVMLPRAVLAASIAVLAIGTSVSLLPSAACAQRAKATATPIAAGTPESVGMSTARLARLTGAFKKEIAEKKLPGVVMMVARKGRLVYSTALGVRDPKSEDPMRTNTLFRIYSMTKPMVSVATMLLVEDGALLLTDPVSKWLPAFKDVKVWTASGEIAAERAMTVQDLLRHTAGLPYGELTQNAAVKDALAKAGLFKPGVIDFDVRDMTGAEQVERLSKIPLLYQPGSTWEYSLASDLLGRVVEAASGKRLGDFLSERLFRPLKMNDTTFWVAETNKARLAQPFEKDVIAGTPITLIDVSKQPGNDSGGAGAISTAGDYLRFAQMLANGGTLEGQRIMSRATLRLMTSDHLGSRLPLAPTPGGMVLGASTYTFGLGFAVRPADGIAPFPGSAGDFNWGGYAGTFFWVDPKEQLVATLMVQSAGALRLHHRLLYRQLVYQAIAD
ncbi:MAG TPA: serine hydrolase domain-containing protein [Hyphomicrobiaceae bacterium]|jgi:CubicO group peptidase (beta-lactamase class C family)|nr:serine hydrolase domain-containing protein [Hyphomicrobiaceae bacterium]